MAPDHRPALQPDIPPEGYGRVVIAIDDPAQRSALVRELGKDRALTVDEAASWDALKALLDDFDFDVVLLADTLSDRSGIETNNLVRSFFRDPPATILLGPSDVRAAIKAYRCGVADYLTEEARVGQVIRDAVTRAAKSVHARRQERSKTELLELLAQRDSLTGLANRHSIEERLEQLTRIKARYGSPFAIILIRFNEYEQICGGFGYHIGDHALLAFAKRLANNSRAANTLARLTRDTFIYLVDRDVTPDGITGACRRLSRTMSFSLNLDDVGLSISAAIGPALFPRDGATVIELIEAAELKLSGDWGANLSAAELPGDGIDTATKATSETARGQGSQQRRAAPNAPRSKAFGRARNGEKDPTPSDKPPAGTPAPTTRIANRRRDLRHRTLKRGQLVVSDGRSTVDCVIRDVSIGGARVAVEGQFLVPDRMELFIPDSDRRRPVEKRWQRDDELGLMFLDVGEDREPGPDPSVSVTEAASL